MHTTSYPKIVAFVEGTMERLFINNNFSYVRLVPISNGSGWTVEALSKRISSLFSALNVQADAVVVWLDREKQADSSEAISEVIKQGLIESGASGDHIFVCVPNRMTENILLADEQIIRSEFDNPAYSYEHEGANGKSVLSGLYKEKGITYKETYHGVNLMKKIRLKRASEKNLAAASFISGFELPCWWI